MSQNLQQKIENILANNPNVDDREIAYQVKELLYETEVQNFIDKKPRNILNLVEESLEIYFGEPEQSGVIKTGFDDLDALLGGFRLGEFVVIGGRPGMGKSHFLVNLSLNISKTNPVLYVTFDLSEFLLTTRFVSAVSKIPLRNFLHRNFNEEEKQKISAIGNEFANRQLFIHDSSNNAIAAIKAHCKKLIQENGVQVIVVDYLQMMTSIKHKQNRELEISYICRELKSLAKEFNVCVIAASQLSREVERRSWDKRPRLSDLRDSGGIEQDADKVLFIYRPEYYAIDEDEEGNSTRNLAKIIVAKNRTGCLGEINLLIDNDFTNFLNYRHEFSFIESRLGELEEDKEDYSGLNSIDAPQVPY